MMGKANSLIDRITSELANRHKSKQSVYATYPLDLAELKEGHGYKGCLRIVAAAKDRVQDYLEDNGIEYDDIAIDEKGLSIKPCDNEPDTSTIAHKPYVMRKKICVTDDVSCDTDISQSIVLCEEQKTKQEKEKPKHEDKSEKKYEYSKTTKEKRRAYDKEWRVKNKEKRRIQSQRWYAKNKEKCKEKFHAYYIAHKMEILDSRYHRIQERYPFIIKELYEGNRAAIDGMLEKYPFDPFGEGIVRRVLAKQGIREGDGRRDDCYSAGTLAYLYGLYRCSYHDFGDNENKVRAYIWRSVEPVVKTVHGYDPDRMIAKHNNLKLVYIDSGKGQY